MNVNSSKSQFLTPTRFCSNTSPFLAFERTPPEPEKTKIGYRLAGAGIGAVTTKVGVELAEIAAGMTLGNRVTNGGELMPRRVSQQVIKEMVEESGLKDKGFKYRFVKGTYDSSTQNARRLNFFYNRDHFLGRLSRARWLPDFLKDGCKTYLKRKGIKDAESSAAYVTESLYAYAPENRPSLILHEIGHAKVQNQGFLGKTLLRARMATPFIAVPAIAVALFSDKTDKFAKNAFAKVKKFAHDNIFKIILLLNAPMLIDELLASKEAITKLKNSPIVKPEHLQAFKNKMGIAFTTYLLFALAFAGAAKLGVFLKDKITGYNQV